MVTVSLKLFVTLSSCFKVQLRESAKSFDEKVVELQTSKRQADEMLEDVQARFKELETSSRTETELLQNQVGVF